MTSSYIDATRIKDKIYISERNTAGIRRVYSHPIEYRFWHEDPDGTDRSIYDTPISKKTFGSVTAFKDALAMYQRSGIKTFESDTDAVYDVLEKLYPGDETPPLNIAILDIETDKDPARGFSSVNNPYSIINAITIHQKWTDLAYTIIVCPPNMTMDTARALLDARAYQDTEGNIIYECPEDDTFGVMSEDDGYYLVESEAELLLLTIDLLKDADVISGWNSMFFDIPYTIHRIRVTLGDEDYEDFLGETGTFDNPVRPSEASEFHLRQLNLFPIVPSLKMTEHYGKTEKTYRLHGRIHLDYLDLYRKFTFEELHSYSLDAILQHEVGQTKIAYEGSLDELYRYDLRRFSCYSRQDVMGLSAIDDKRQMIALANQMAHMAGVTLDKTLGSVAIIEQAISKELHRQGKIANDKVVAVREYPIPGAFVLQPRKGLYRWIGSFDFNSLYPTVIRMLNISPETIVGFVEPTETLMKLHNLMTEQKMEGAEAWSHFAGTLEYQRVVNRTDEYVSYRPEGSEEAIEVSGAELAQYLEENNYTITAFGLVLTREFEGIIPFCLTKWYFKRKEYQGMKKATEKEIDGLTHSGMGSNQKGELETQAKLYDMLQQVYKIFLNSLYGSFLNAHFRFGDPRMGASTTMSGRICLQTMTAEAERAIEHEDIYNYG